MRAMRDEGWDCACRSLRTAAKAQEADAFACVQTRDRVQSMVGVTADNQEQEHTLVPYAPGEGSARIQAAGGPDPGRVPSVLVLIPPALLGCILWQQRRPQAGAKPGRSLSLCGPTHKLA